jgi:hypothetical protein
MISLGPSINWELIAWIVTAFFAFQGLGLACFAMGIFFKKNRPKSALLFLKIALGLSVVAIAISAGAVVTRIAQVGEFPIRGFRELFVVVAWFAVPTVVATCCWVFWRRGQRRNSVA